MADWYSALPSWWIGQVLKREWEGVVEMMMIEGLKSMGSFQRCCGSGMCVRCGICSQYKSERSCCPRMLELRLVSSLSSISTEVSGYQRCI